MHVSPDRVIVTVSGATTEIVPAFEENTAGTLGSSPVARTVKATEAFSTRRFTHSGRAASAASTETGVAPVK